MCKAKLLNVLQSLLLILLVSDTLLAEPSLTPQLQAPGGHEQYLKLSPDGRYLILDTSKEIYVWDTVQQKLLRKLQGLERVYSTSFSPDSRYLSVSDYPRWIGYFDCSNDVRTVWTFKEPWKAKTDGEGVQSAGAYHLTFSPDGHHLLAVGGGHGAQEGDDVVRIFNPKTGQALYEYPGWSKERKFVSNFLLSDDSKYLIRSALDKLQAYSLADGEKTNEIRLGGNSGHMSPYGEHLILGHWIENGGRLVHRLYSIPEFRFLGDSDYRELPPQQPGGPLHWERTRDGLLIKNGQRVVFNGNTSDTLIHWVENGGFILDRDLDVDGSHTLFSQTGEPLRPLNDLAYEKDVAYTFLGYGGPGSITSLLDGKEWGKFDFIYSVAVAEAGNRMAIGLKSGILLIDIPKSRQAGLLVPCRPTDTETTET